MGCYMSEKNKIEVIIGGAFYVLQGKESPEHMRKVATYIDEVINDVKKLDISNRMSTAQIAMLASINVADDLIKCEERLEEQEKEQEEFFNEFTKLENENNALIDKIAEMQIEMTRLRKKAK